MDVLSEPLTDAEVRVLGVLVEKQLTTPQSYPLTENALLTGCNQTTNRAPLVDYDTSDLRPTLIRLRERALAKRVRRAGERVEKHAHRLDEQLRFSSPAPLAVLTVLMLRGAQTPGELRSRTARLHPGLDAATLEAALAELADRGMAEALPRRPGEKQVRWRHLLSGADAPVDPAGSVHLAAPPDADDPTRPPPATIQGLARLVERLTARVDRLEHELGLDETPAEPDVAPDLPSVAPDDPEA
jgi:uncharacterized protein